MDLKERLKEFIRNQGVTIKGFERSLGMSNGYVNSISKGLGDTYMNRLIENYPNLNIRWLLTGEGEMLVSGNTATAGVGSNQVVGNNTGHISQTTATDLTSTISSLTEIIKQAQENTATAQAQTNALITQLRESQDQITALINLLNAQNRQK